MHSNATCYRCGCLINVTMLRIAPHIHSIRHHPWSVAIPNKLLASQLLHDIHPGIEAIKQHFRAVW